VPEPRDERVLILAPTGRDAALTDGILEQAGLRSEVCRDIVELSDKLEVGAGAALVAEEALAPSGIVPLVQALARQPPWSDFPLVVLTAGRESDPGRLTTVKMLEPLGNVTLLERPVRMVTLLSALRSALRARRRQYDVRDHLEDRKRAEQMKDEFLATLSHELRTPLQAILGWTRMLRTRDLPAGSAAKALETIERNARWQVQLIEDLLDVSRIITGKFRLDLGSVDLRSVVQSAMQALKGTADAKNLILDARLPSAVTPAVGDSLRLEQVVWNLLSNAIKFTPDGGRITVTLEETDGTGVVSVTDTGQGISPDFLPHIFERFRQADSTTTRAHGGLGLGLAIVRHIVELHGGTVRAESAGPGTGTCFVVTVPLRVGRVTDPTGTPRPSDTVSPAGLPRLHGVEVVVVDDDADSRDIVQSVLEQCGARVTAHASAAAALKAISDAPPGVLVTDVSMPGEDGYALIRQLRAQPPEHGGAVPAVALTAHARAEDRQRAAAAGFDVHVAKPVEPAELARIVAELAARAGSGGVTVRQRTTRL
jgi:signal transduction histidine kinase/CheY-like chemotaxis protein